MSQGVDVNYVCPACLLPGHVSQGLFHSYGVRRHLVNRARPMMYFTKTKISYFRFASPPTPEIPLQDCFKQLPTLWPEGLWLPGELHFSSIRSPFSLVSSAVCPPFSYYFRFLLQFSALRKFTPTGACYSRLLTTSNFVSCIMKNAGEIEVVFFFLSLLGAIRSSG